MNRPSLKSAGAGKAGEYTWVRSPLKNAWSWKNHIIGLSIVIKIPFKKFLLNL